MSEEIRNLYNINTSDLNTKSSIENISESEIEDLSLFSDENIMEQAGESVSLQSANSSALMVNSLDSDTKTAIIEMLENILNTYGESFETTKENNGIIAKAWDWVKNSTGIGVGSDKVKSKIDTLKNDVAMLKEDSSNLAQVYKDITGNDLTTEELNALSKGEADFSDSEVIKSVTKYQQGQKQNVNIISSIGSALAVTGLMAAGVVAAPFTGGMSLGASLAAIGTLTAAGTAAYMIPQVADGMTEKDGYSGKEIAEDLANGVMSSAFTATGIGAGKAVGSALASNATTQLGKTAAGLAASEATSVIIGDGIAVGNYLTEVAVNDDVNFSWEDLGKTAATATAGSLAAGATAFGTSSVLRPVLTSGTTAQSQVIGRLLSSGISGGSAGAAASASAGSTNYLLTCMIDGKEVDFDEWLDSTTENIASATFTGLSAGVAFEAVQVAVGTPRPTGTKTVQKGVTDDGLEYKDYLDKDGNIIARDIKASDLSNYLKNQTQSQEGLTQYNTGNTSKSANTTARTVRFSFSNVPETIQIDENTSVITNNKGNYYKVDGTLYDWAGNVQSFGSGIIDSKTYSGINNVKSNNTTNNTANNEYVVADELVDMPSKTTISENQSLVSDTNIPPTIVQEQNGINVYNANETLYNPNANTAAGIASSTVSVAGQVSNVTNNVSGVISSGTSIPAAQVPYSYSNVEDAKSYISSLGTEDAKTVLKALGKLKPEDVNLDRLNIAIDILNGGETITQLKGYAKEISNEYSSGTYTVDTMLEIYDALGMKPDGEIVQDKNGIYHSKVDGFGTLTGRAKGSDSVYSKLRNKMLKLGSDLPTSTQEAKPLIGDAQGTRLVLNSIDTISPDAFETSEIIKTEIPEQADRVLFTQYLAGTTEGISPELLTKFESVKNIGLQELSDAQTQTFVSGLSKAIESGTIRISEVHNYYGEDSVPYLSQSQLTQIENAYNKWYQETLKTADTPQSSYKLVQETREDGSEIEYLYDVESGVKFYKSLIVETEEKDSGYTAAQFNLVNQYNQLEELQFRGSNLDELAEIEHIVYDIKSNKDTVSGAEYDSVRQVINKLQTLTQKDADGKTAMEEYNEYFSAVYKSSRVSEFGAKAEEPDIYEDYPLLKELFTKEELSLISKEGLEQLHNQIKASKESQ